MFKRATPKLEHTPFSGLPVETIHVGPVGTQVAVHIYGTLSDAALPVACLAGYTRNMLDFTALPEAINRQPETDIAFILIDLPGRGRSAHFPTKRPYSSLDDADCVLDVLAALDVPRAVLLGEGHGGQVAMLAAQKSPGSVAGAVLIDCGPITDSRALVRTRNNFEHLRGLRGEPGIRAALRKIVGADYPGEGEARLDALAARNFGIDSKGRLVPLFDPRLVAQLDKFDFDDVLEPQWPLFDCLDHVPLMLVRTQMSDQLRRATFEEMTKRRTDAATLVIAGQGSPALLDGAEEISALAAFLRSASVAEDQDSSFD